MHHPMKWDCVQRHNQYLQNEFPKPWNHIFSLKSWHDILSFFIFQKIVKMCYVCNKNKHVSPNIINSGRSWKLQAITNNEFAWFPAWKFDKVGQLKMINMTSEMSKKWLSFPKCVQEKSESSCHENNDFEHDFRLANLTNLDN